MKLQSPTGVDIVGTRDTIPGVALIINSNVQPVDGGSERFEFDHVGETEVDWDGQTSDKALGERVFVDENSSLWMERELKLVAEEEEPAK